MEFAQINIFTTRIECNIITDYEMLAIIKHVLIVVIKSEDLTSKSLT